MNREDSLKIVGNEIVALIVSQAEQVGQAVTGALDDVAEYAAARADHLSLVVGEPGFDEALRAERDNVVLKAAGAAVDSADALDQRVLSVAAGALRLAAVALSAVV